MLDAGAALRAALLPQAALTVNPTFPIAGQPLTLSAVASTAAAGRSVQRTSLQVVDSGGIVANGAAGAATLSLTPAAPGRFVVAQQVTDSAGATSSSTRTIEVYAPGATPQISSGSDGGGGALGAGWLAGLLLGVVALQRSRRVSRR